jgi:hypothetical protein
MWPWKDLWTSVYSSVHLHDQKYLHYLGLLSTNFHSFRMHNFACCVSQWRAILVRGLFILIGSSWKPKGFLTFRLNPKVEFEPRALHLRGIHSTTWAMPATLFCFGYFWDKVLCLCLGYPGPQCSYVLPVKLEWQACATTPSVLLVEMESLELSTQVGLEP